MSSFASKLKNMIPFLESETDQLKKVARHMTDDSLRSFAARNNLRVQRTETGDFISVPVDTPDNAFMSFYESWTSTFSNTGSFTGNNKANIYAMYDVMDENMTEASMMLDTYAEESVSFGVIDNPIKVTVSNPEAQKVLDAVLEKNKILKRAKADIRTMCKYGDAAYVLEFPQSLYDAYNDLPSDIKDETDPGEFFNIMDLDIYPISPKNFQINADEQGRVINYKQDNSLQSDSKRIVSSRTLLTKVWQPWQFARFSIDDDTLRPYGKSILYGMRTLFDQLSTLEALLAMSRASKVQRLVIKVPVPSSNATEAFQQISRTKAQFKSTIFSDAVGTKSGRKVAGLTEVFFMPSGPDYSIDTIKNDIDISSTEDVNHFLDKALRATKLPKGFFSGEDGEDSGTALAERDQKFGKALLQVQNAYAEGLVELCSCILAHAGFLVDKLEITVEIQRPTRLSKNLIEEYKNIIDFISALREMVQEDNPKIKYPSTNLAQLFVLAGIPVDYVKLLLAQNPIAVLNDTLMYDLLSSLEVKPYNYEKSNKKDIDAQSDVSRDEKGQLVLDGENSSDVDINDIEQTSVDDAENPIDDTSIGFGVEPDHYKVASVSNSKDLYLCERRTVVRVSSREVLAAETSLKSELIEVAKDLRGKKLLNEQSKSK